MIFFSSTSTAGKWCEEGYRYLSAMLFNDLSTGSSSQWLHFLAEKGVHVTLFAVLGMLLWKALPASDKKFFWIVLIGAAVGSSSETLQRFFPDRDPSIRDVCINLGATALGAAIGRIWLAPPLRLHGHAAHMPSRIP